MNVSTYNTQRRFSISSDSVIALARQVILAEGEDFDEVSLHFVGKQKICKLHADYFNDPSPTDCISFPMDNHDSVGYKVLGEVFVCPEAALLFTRKHGGELYEEITLYIVHGLLHLLGYDDIDEEDQKEMRAREQFHMSLLKMKDLLCKAETDTKKS